MVHFNCDKTGADLAESETTTLRIAGPLRSMLGRSRVELGKPAAQALARWLGAELARPDVETIPGPEPVQTDLS